MKRRDFLQCLGGLSAWGLTPTVDVVWAADGGRPYDRLLILIELKGGNDGLNTVIPFSDPTYATLRPRLGLSRDAVLHLSERAGLHPAMQPLLPVWQADELALIQGVGYPNPNLSHFRSIEIWDTASSSE